ncbi:dihydrodipicolinate synthase family protein [Variovorax sp. PBL-E5]|uniref:dihydrodipicolinate synthase family protein n=1 Tax=Variovorax sp. PBL-E5 TaxID=434014 RepID=UPI0013180CD8|nr:dihydrodipicolinate synthase family protein [Variovorax sp. PBL-E5]VTU15988.1 5-dehydro-4-deoxyglucarate dehydratase [Variovorax sp. PBL-E5]
MKTSPISVEEFAESVLAVPPLARRADLSLDAAQNRKLIRHIEAGGVRTLLYGGNANLYHASVHEYGELLSMLADAAADTTRVIPAIGPDFGKMSDQARVLRGSGFRTAMVLPMQGFATPQGIVDGISRVVDLLGMPVTVYLKDDKSIGVDALGKLVDDQRVLVVKYAVVRPDPAVDAYLDALIARITPRRIVSGMGERPTLVHLARLGLASYTTGSGCIAPAPCRRLFEALKAGDLAAAQPIYDRFMPLETLRDSISLIRVLHDAVSLSGLADMGPHLPLLSASPADRHEEIGAAAQDLLAYNRDPAFATQASS